MDIRDPIYGNMEFADELVPLIQNPYFQRLRDIKQTALAFSAYPGAEHTRFAHSLGVAHLMQIATKGKVKDPMVLIQAALLHDIGHGAFSHLWEDIAGFDHEKMTQKLLVEEFGLPEVAKVIEKKHPDYLFISSSIDVDKLDYMERDAYHSGVRYGAASVDRIVKYLQIYKGKICILPKNVTEVGNVIKNRADLYASIYYNKHVRARDALLKALFKRVKEIQNDIVMSEVMRSALNNTLTTEQFLMFTDSTVKEHIKMWCSEKDEILSDLANRFYKGISFSAVKISDEKTIKAVKEDLEKAGYDTMYYFLDDKIKRNNYENEVWVKTGDELTPLSKLDPIIKSLNEHPITKRYIIGPREILQKYKVQ